MPKKSLVSSASILGLIVTLFLPAQPVASSEFGAQATSATVAFTAINGLTSEPLDDFNLHYWSYSGGSGPITVNGGIASKVFDNGRYWIEATPATYNSGLTRTVYDLVVESGTPTLSTQSGGQLSSNEGTYTLSLSPTNVKVKVAMPNGAPFEASETAWLDVELQRLEGDGRWSQIEWLWADNDIVGAYVTEQGTYRMRINVYGNAEVAQVTKQFTIGAQAPSPENPQDLGTVNLNTPNFQFRIMHGDSEDLAPVGDQQFSIRKSDSLNEDWHWTSPVGATTLPAVGAFYFSEPGTYFLKLRPWNLPDAAETIYEVTVANDLSISIAGRNPVNGVYDLTLKIPNFVIKPQGKINGVVSNLTNASVRISRADDPNVEVTGGFVNDPSTGLISMFVEPGSYTMEVFPNANDYKLLNSKYQLYVTSSNGQTVISLQPSHNTTPITAVSGVYTVRVNEANVLGRVVRASGNGTTPLGSDYQQGRWVNISLEVLSNGNWEWRDINSQANELGEFGLFITDPGTYRIRIEPSGYPGLSVTKLTPAALELTEQDDLASPTDLGDLMVLASNLSARVTDSQGNLVRHAGAELRQGNNFIDWLNTDSQGNLSLSLDDGSYELVLHPEWGTSGESTRKQYSLVVTNGIGAVVGVNPNDDGIYELTLGSPNLRGVVLNPSGSNPIFEAEVIPVNESTGEEMWEYSARTGIDGGWGMQLPAGTYRVYAKSPWGNVEFGAGAKSALFTVAENGSVSSSASGFSSTALELRLSNPTFSGTVVRPDNNQPMTNAQVCLIRGNGDYNWNCSQTNSLGQWSLSKPEGFSDFSSDTELVIGEIFGERQFAERRLSGAEVENILTVGAGYTDGLTYSNIVLSPAAPNLEVTVLAGGQNAARVWVSVDIDGYGWVGSGETNSEGKAKLYIPTSELLRGELNIQADVQNNFTLSAQYASTRTKISSVGSVTGTRLVTVNLTTPNFSGVVLEPSGTTPVRHSWIEIFDLESGDWMGGASTNSAGEFKITLDKAVSGLKVYRVQVNPAWNSSGDFSKQTYFASVDSSGTLTALRVNSINGTVINPSANSYSLRLATPSVVGVVRDANGTVRDSWVVPLDNSIPSNPDYLWESGTNSRSNGGFSMALPDGSYLLEANPPWQRSGTSKSARCNITVGTSGSLTQITNGDPSCWSNETGEVTLNLRAPNLKFRLVDANNQPVRFAHVGAGAGAWHTWTQSDAEGWVSLFIDAQEIITLNPQLDQNGDSIDVYFWFDPPYGNGDIVRWECKSGDNKPVCSSVPDVVKGGEGSYLSSPVVISTPVAFAAPNTKVRVTKPGQLPVGAGAWVALFLNTSGTPNNCDGSREWVSGAVTDSSGFAAFNLTNAQMTAIDGYCLEVNPTWTERQLFAPALYPVASHSLLTAQNSNFSVLDPNLTVRVLDPSGTKAVRWSWVGVEEVVFNAGTSKYDSVRWINGAGTDSRGLANLSLQSGKLFRLTAYPGPGSNGSQISCIIRTDGGGIVLNDVSGECGAGSLSGSQLSITLSAGNISGTITREGTSIVVPGAIVLAESAGRSVTTVTGADGKYYLQLDNGNWNIKIFVVSRPGDPVQLLSDTTGTDITVNGTATVNRTVAVQQ